MIVDLCLKKPHPIPLHFGKGEVSKLLIQITFPWSASGGFGVNVLHVLPHDVFPRMPVQRILL